MTYRKISDLDHLERTAGRAYGSDSTHHHTLAQRIRGSEYFPGYADFCAKVREVVPAISSAIQKFALTEAVTVYCGIGYGVAAVGSVYGDPVNAMIGMTYCYGGFISTSESREVAERFTRTGYKTKGDRPMLLVFNLPIGFHVLPMRELGNDSSFEKEFLVNRNVPFRISDAHSITLDGVGESVLQLTLEPV